MSFTTKSSLLYNQDQHHSEDDYGFPPSDKPSYYKRGNLLARSSTSSFRQKYKGFRARSSSYNSLDDDNNQNDGLLNSQDIPTPSVVVPTTAAPNTSLFVRKHLGMTAERSSTAPASYFSSSKQDLDDNYYDSNEENDSDESTLFAKQGSYSRQNFNRTSSWKSCVLRAVGVKRSTR
ncbi:unnamed protein product [Mucor hiemalis]